MAVCRAFGRVFPPMRLKHVGAEQPLPLLALGHLISETCTAHDRSFCVHPLQAVHPSRHASWYGLMPGAVPMALPVGRSMKA